MNVVELQVIYLHNAAQRTMGSYKLYLWYKALPVCKLFYMITTGNTRHKSCVFCTQVKVHEAAGLGGCEGLLLPFGGGCAGGQQPLSVPDGCIADNAPPSPDYLAPLLPAPALRQPHAYRLATCGMLPCLLVAHHAALLIALSSAAPFHRRQAPAGACIHAQVIITL